MGASNKIIFPFYKSKMKDVIKPVALLGFTDNNVFEGVLYDRKLGNWDINSEWQLGHKYNTIISTRCPYFAKDPEDFIKRCHAHLNDGGMLYVDWGLGDHWRFPMFKIGWIKNGEHEYAYSDSHDNLLWSTIWEDEIIEHDECKKFHKAVRHIGYGENFKEYIYKEVPKVLNISFIRDYFHVKYDIITILEPFLSMNIFVQGKKYVK